jgi:hypothetical protein
MERLVGQRTFEKYVGFDQFENIYFYNCFWRDQNLEPPRNGRFLVDLNLEPPRNGRFLVDLNLEPSRNGRFWWI